MISVVFGILALLVSVLLTLVVLVQNSKGGGLSGTFGANNISSMIGARRATQDVEKFTWYLAAALLAVSFLANIFAPEDTDALKRSRMSTQIQSQSLNLNQQTALPSNSGGGEQQP